MLSIWCICDMIFSICVCACVCVCKYLVCFTVDFFPFPFLRKWNHTTVSFYSLVFRLQ